MKTQEQKDKSVAIALDILAQLSAGTIVAKKGNYIRLPESAVHEDDVDLQQSVARLTPEEPCEVCARGAIAVSLAKLYDLIPGGYTNYEPSDFDDAVFEIFTDDESDDAERFFERWVDSDEIDYEQCIRAGTSANRLAMIAKNIIRNKGVLDRRDYRLEDAIMPEAVISKLQYDASPLKGTTL